MNQLTAIGLTILFFAGVYYILQLQQGSTQEPIDDTNVCVIKTVSYGAPLSISEPHAGTYNYSLIATPDGIEVWRQPCHE